MDEAGQQKEDNDLQYKLTSTKQREDGRVEIRYRRNGYDKSFYGHTEKEAGKKFKIWFNNEIKKNNPPAKKIETKIYTVGKWIEQWLEIYKKPNVTEQTYKTIELIVNKYIKKPIANRNIKSITNEDIQNILNNAKFNGKPQNKINVYVKNIFEVARLNKIIKDNPTDGTTFKKHQYINCIAMTQKEQEEFKQAIKGCDYELFYLYLLYTGCRRSEALKLKLSDIKIDKIHIRGTKTEKSDRYIPYFENVKELLKNCKEEDVFKFAPQTVTRYFKNYSPNHTLRDLRKTFATNCHEKGISPKVVQKWLGHTNMSMTMNVYTDVTNDFELNELKKM